MAKKKDQSRISKKGDKKASPKNSRSRKSMAYEGSPDPDFRTDGAKWTDGTTIEKRNKMAAGGKVRGMGCAVKGGKMSPNSQ